MVFIIRRRRVAPSAAYDGHITDANSETPAHSPRPMTQTQGQSIYGAGSETQLRPYVNVIFIFFYVLSLIQEIGPFGPEYFPSFPRPSHDTHIFRRIGPTWPFRFPPRAVNRVAFSSFLNLKF
jgi:hypothetical protein